MPYFAVVAAVRIQSWISRTPDLRLVRGASHALTNTTKQESLIAKNVLPSDAFDTNTAEVAGVCVLRSYDPDTLDSHVDLALRHLQRELPGVEWSAWRAQADSYVDAYDLVNHKASGNAQLRHWPHQLPLSLDLPFARACDRCSYELATKEIYTPDGTGKEVIGPDCARRHKDGATSEFLTFDALAATAQGTRTIGRRDATNHLATVCADGNRVGQFFTAVAALRDPALQATLSNALDAAAHTAVDEASTCGPDGAAVAITHFVGGDDIFASVAAPYAWRYVETLGRTFEEEFRAQVADALPASEPDSPQIQEVRAAAAKVSLGIGVAFANKKHPIADCRITAAAAEQAAKAATKGDKSAVSWIDITVEPSMGQGSAPVPRGRWVTVEELTKDFETPHPVLLTNSSARAMLASLLRPDPQKSESAADFAAAVCDWAERVGRLHDKDDRPGLASCLPDEASSQADDPIDRLRHTVDRARWWPAPADDNEEGDDQ